jgi:hypothetical protein
MAIRAFSANKLEIGSGRALLATQPNNAIVLGSGGTYRGEGSIDLQFRRSGDANVAGGRFGLIIGGASNKTNSSYNSAIIGGSGNNICNVNKSSIINGTFDGIGSGNYSTIIGGINNCLCNSAFSIAGGDRVTGITSSGSVLISTRGHICSSANSVLLGGRNNSANLSSDTTMIGGRNNCAFISPYAGMIGGRSNHNQSTASFLGGGVRNCITLTSLHNSIIGGNDNSMKQSYNSSILGGVNNLITGEVSPINSSTILGGCSNRNYSSNFSVIMGGRTNYIRSSCYSVAGGGSNINICSSSGVFAATTSGIVRNSSQGSALLGGRNNCMSFSRRSLILGGDRNCIGGADISAIIAGDQHVISGEQIDERNVIIGGLCNKICKNRFSIIAGGGSHHICHTAQAEYNAIFGGYQHHIFGGATHDNNLIAGGYYHCILSSQRSSIIGGNNNKISTSDCAFMAGGYFNYICAASHRSSAIGGGSNHINASVDSSIIGGCLNCICETSNFSSIIGGYKNAISNTAGYNVILAGQCHHMKDSFNSVILGGFQHLTNKFNESAAIGGYKNCINNFGGLDTYYSVFLGGKRNIMTNHGVTIGGGCVSGNNMQHIIASLAGSTNNNSLTELGTFGNTPDATTQWRIGLTGNSAWFMDLSILAFQSGGAADVKAFSRKYAFRNDGGTVTAIESGIKEDIGSPNWNIYLNPNDADDTIRLQVSGETAKTILWKGTAKINEIVRLV